MKPVLFFLLFLTSLSAQTPQELDKTVRRLAPDLVASTVAVMLQAGSGSGVIVSEDGLVITAAHVTSIANRSLTVLLADGRELPATSLGVDHETDGALLQINAPGPFPYRPYLEGPDYQVGEWVIATGHPGGPVVGRPSPVRLGRILKAGIAGGFADPITTDALVISGDSGGPLFNLRGEVIGINSNVGGSWSLNNHVPLPAIIDRWDALLNGESFGRPTQMGQAPENSLFDEPYAELREQFEEALKRNAEQEDARELLARPRLLDPHHMQDLLNRWEPNPDAEKAPFYGFTLAASSPRVISVLPDSPAASAGLSKGDLITSANNEAIQSTISLALKLKDGGPLTLTTSTGKSITLTPSETIARAHFPQPVAGMVNMMVIDDDNDAPIIPSDEFLSPFQSIRDELIPSVLLLRKADGTPVASATVIHETGQLLTKSSEIEKVEGLVASFKEDDYPVEIMAVDEDYDIALIKISATGLRPVKWEVKEPKVGQLLLTPTPKGFVSGVITQPARSAPKKGYELNQNSNEPSSYLGITFAVESVTPVIETVDIGSPADKVGLLEGDKILKVDNSKLDGIEDLGQRISTKPPGTKLTFLIKRNDEELTFEPILDVRPPAVAGVFDQTASRRNGALTSLSARGGKLSKRRDDFPYAIYHDQVISPRITGAPLINLEGEVVGINIARALRHRSLAVPTKKIDQIVAQLRKKAKGN